MKPVAILLLFYTLIFQETKGQEKADGFSRQEMAVRNYLDSADADEVEGIYTTQSGAFFRLAIRKINDTQFNAIILDMDDRLKADWKQGDVKARLEKSAVPGVYSIRWIWNNRSASETSASFTRKGMLRVKFPLENIDLLKIYPISSKG